MARSLGLDPLLNYRCKMSQPLDDSTLAASILAHARDRLAAAAQLVEHCVGQLNDAQVWWRPREPQNSIGNLLLHLTGNLRERILSLIAGQPSVRDRPAEFAHREHIAREQLLAAFRSTVAECDQALAGLTAAQLLEPRSYQGVNRRIDLDVVGVILHTLTHLAGHAQEIVFMTRLQLGDGYRYTSPAMQPRVPHS